MNDDDVKLPALGATWQDAASAVAKGAFGSIPIVGSMLGEVMGLIIPNQRLDRIEAYLRFLGERLEKENVDSLGENLRDPERIDLFEEGAVQSLRAVSDERKAYIASIVANGLSGDERDILQAKRLLRLLSEVDDGQIIVLVSYIERNYHDAGFREQHKALLEPIGTHAGSRQEDVEADALHELARAELLRLGLLKSEFRLPMKGQNPNFDPKTGMLKAGSRSLTLLGRMLLVQIGLASYEEAWRKNYE
jgi:hypothetical protein